MSRVLKSLHLCKTCIHTLYHYFSTLQLIQTLLEAEYCARMEHFYYLKYKTAVVTNYNSLAFDTHANNTWCNSIDICVAVYIVNTTAVNTSSHCPSSRSVTKSTLSGYEKTTPTPDRLMTGTGIC